MKVYIIFIISMGKYDSINTSHISEKNRQACNEYNLYRQKLHDRNQEKQINKRIAYFLDLISIY